MRKGVIGCLIGAAATVFLGIVCLVAVGALANSFPVGDRVAHIDVEGMITSQSIGGFFGDGFSMVDRTLRDLKDAREDDGVVAVVLRINSPGGEVTASDTIYHAVVETSEVKPVVVFMDSLAASGGYYIACGADEIFANETTLTGSIGVIIQTLNYYEFFEKIGLEALIFKSGELKDTLSGARELSVVEKEYVQSMVDQMYDKFLGIVADGRGIERSVLRNGIADGRVMTGADALEAKLVDANGYIEDAYDRARELGGSPGAKIYRYRRDGGVMGILGASLRGRSGVAGTQGGRLEIDLSDRLLPRLRPGMIYLLPSHYLP